MYSEGYDIGCVCVLMHISVCYPYSATASNIESYEILLASYTSSHWVGTLLGKPYTSQVILLRLSIYICMDHLACPAASIWSMFCKLRVCNDIQ